MRGNFPVRVRRASEPYGVCRGEVLQNSLRTPNFQITITLSKKISIFRSDGILTEYRVVLSDHASDLLSHIALRLVKIIEPYLVEQDRMTNAQLLMY